MFLRGVSGVSERDPEKDNRSAAHSVGNSNNRVGSIQEDALAEHGHEVWFYLPGSDQERNFVSPAPNKGGGLARGALTGGVTSTLQSEPNTSRIVHTSSETRPRNAYVHYIIKAK